MTYEVYSQAYGVSGAPGVYSTGLRTHEWRLERTSRSRNAAITFAKGLPYYAVVVRSNAVYGSPAVYRNRQPYRELGKGGGYTMTEEQWLTSTDPAAMMQCLLGSAQGHHYFSTKRKLRLFVCACARHIWDHLHDKRSRNAVTVAERFADGETTARQMNRAQQSAYVVPYSDLLYYQQVPVLFAAWTCMAEMVETARYMCDDGLWQTRFNRQHIPQPALLRCQFGNPFRPVTLNPVWVNSTVLDIAQRIYGDRKHGFDPTPFPMLWDALAEAGCDDADMRMHCLGLEPCPLCTIVGSNNEGYCSVCCAAGETLGKATGWRKSPVPHYRGCWVTDLILGKA